MASGRASASVAEFAPEDADANQFIGVVVCVGGLSSICSAIIRLSEQAARISLADVPAILQDG